MATPLKLLKKGSAPSLIDTDTANQLIQAVNDLRSMIVVPGGAGRLLVGQGNVTLDLSGLLALLGKNQTSQDAINQTAAPGSPGSPGGGGVDVNIRINQIITALNNSSISATCNDDGTVGVTLTIPGLPPVT